MVTVSLEDIKHDFVAYVRRAQAGESILIAEDQEPIVELKPLAARLTKKRPFGLCAGEFTVPDDFDDPLPEDILRAFEGQ